MANDGSCDVPEVAKLRKVRSYEKPGRLGENGITEFRMTVGKSAENISEDLQTNLRKIRH
jgi:hypothetical protein